MNAKRIQLSQISYMHLILSYIHTYINLETNVSTNTLTYMHTVHIFSTYKYIHTLIHIHTYIISGKRFLPPQSAVSLTGAAIFE